jgi:hypothetical protein
MISSIVRHHLTVAEHCRRHLSAALQRAHTVHSVVNPVPVFANSLFVPSFIEYWPRQLLFLLLISNHTHALIGFQERCVHVNVVHTFQMVRELRRCAESFPVFFAQVREIQLGLLVRVDPRAEIVAQVRTRVIST